MLFLVLDTNVIVSAMISRNPNSPPVKLLELMFDNKFIPLFNDEIIAEYDEVLHRQKFNLPANKINSVLSSIQIFGMKSERFPSDEIFPDTKDIVFYEVTISKPNAFLVTGNSKHFPQKPFVITPAQAIDVLAGT